MCRLFTALSGLVCVSLVSGCLSATDGSVAPAGDTTSPVADVPQDPADERVSPTPSFACNGQGVTPIGDVTGAAGVTVKLAGQASLGEPYTCQGETNTNTWGDCRTPIALRDTTGQLLTDSLTADEWGCIGYPFGQVPPPCVPLSDGVAYWVWGEVVQGFPPADDGAPSPYDALLDEVPTVMVVDDYCLQTTPQGLAGSYEVTLTGAGGFGVYYAGATILWREDGTLGLTIGPHVGAYIAIEAYNLELGDGWLRFDTDHDYLPSQGPISWHLVSERNTLRVVSATDATGTASYTGTFERQPRW